MPATADDNPAHPPIVVGIGASAGGVEALSEVVSRLPASFTGAIVVVLHVSASGTSVLAEILDRAGPLKAVPAQDGAPLSGGVIHVAPPDRHLIVDEYTVRLSAGPRENGHRPAVDPTLASLAGFGPRAVGVILSGTLDDGTRGMFELKSAGGTTLVQDPAEARHPGMILSAMRYVEIDETLPLSGIADALVKLEREASMTTDPQPAQPPEGEPSATRYTCPDCGGVLWRHQQGAGVRYACSVGHTYGPDGLNGAQSRNVEEALWAASRILGDRRTLLDEMAEQAEAHGRSKSAGGFRSRAAEAAQAEAVIRELIESGRVSLMSGEADED